MLQLAGTGPLIVYWDRQLTLSLSPCISSHFPGEPRLAGVYWSKRWWRWWLQLDYWSCKSCKAPVKSSPPTNQHPVFLQAGCPSCRPTNRLKALKGITGDCQLVKYTINNVADRIGDDDQYPIPLNIPISNTRYLNWSFTNFGLCRAKRA